MKKKDCYRNIGQNISKCGSYSLIIVCAMHLLLSAGKVAMASSDSGIVLNTTFDMLCFPPTSPENTPPCPVPVGLGPSLIATDPGGELHNRVR